MPITYEAVRHAELEILHVYGDNVNWENKTTKAIHKWGQNNTIGSTAKTIWQSPGDNETYATDDAIDYVVCTNDSFTGTVDIEGHTLADGNLTFNSPYNYITDSISNNRVTLTGQTPVALPTPLARANRLSIVGSEALAENEYIYVYQSGGTVTAGVPQTDADIHMKVRGGIYRQSEKASTAIESTAYFLVQSIRASVATNKDAQVEVYFQTRTVGNTFRSVLEPIFLTSTGTSVASVGTPDEIQYIIRPNSDFRVVAKTVGTTPASDVTVTARVSGIIARIDS